MKEKPITPLYIWLILGVAMITATVATVFYGANFSGFISNEHEKWGQFGDFFGGVLNPSFSFLTLIALLLTLRYQSEELKLTKEELVKSTSALEGQEKSLNVQNFDNTFFNLLRLHNEIVDSLTSAGMNGTGQKNGRHSFSNIVMGVNSRYSRAGENLKDAVAVENIFNDVMKKCSFSADHYFRNLYRIVKFIHRSELDIDKSFYIGTLRAQLSSNELVAIFFNGLCKSGQKFKPLIEEYSLFDNIKISLIPKRKGLIGLYDRSSFGECDVDAYLND